LALGFARLFTGDREEDLGDFLGENFVGRRFFVVARLLSIVGNGARRLGG
jgi:hypothetical protein